MEKPELSTMSNRDALQKGFHENWKMTYTVPEVDISDPIFAQECWSVGFQLRSAENGELVKTIPFKEFKTNATFDVNGQYNWAGLGLTFSQQQTNFLSQHGRMIMKANSGFLENMIAMTSYESDGSRQGGEGDERADNYNRIWGQNAAYQRYPYNTVLVTSDLLLHTYHRLFSNSLKYYEETVARPVVAELSQSLFEKFSTLEKNTSDPTLKKYYEFLEAYRSIPYAILPPNQEIIDKISTMMQNGENADLTDEQVEDIITQRSKKIFAQLTPTYQAAAEKTLQEILAGNNSNGKNILLETLSPNLLDSFDGFNGLKFDFSQFKPRGHYTTDALLKTYFMGMKRMMREKLFFADKEVATAGLVMINNIQNKDLINFTTFYNSIQKLIGEDDDVNIHDLQKFIAEKQRNSDKNITENIDETIQKELMALRPQKIMSVSYTTPGEGDVTEQEAKDITAGFVFFWEKFTIDSRFFDQFTAGSAEKESVNKPRVQSALMAADNLVNLPITQRFAKLWMEKNATIFGISSGQIAAYDNIKWATAQNKILTAFDFGTTIYHTRLKHLTTLFIDGWDNAPYFMQDPLYQNKLLNTYLGSYTELKHDTILYVKQAYAELGMWWEWPCSRSIEPPALPVPKWYVEPNIDLIDALMQLTTETKEHFSGEQYTQFSDYLTFVKKIAIAQTQNQKISDEDFEQLRLSFNTLYTITTPQKLFGYPLQKEKRWSIIADIFISWLYGPLYEAVGRPYLMTMMISDNNGQRMVVGPVFSHYEFYEEQASFQPDGGGRYTDQDRQNNYDALKEKEEENIIGLPLWELIQSTK